MGRAKTLAFDIEKEKLSRSNYEEAASKLSGSEAKEKKTAVELQSVSRTLNNARDLHAGTLARVVKDKKLLVKAREHDKLRVYRRFERGGDCAP